MASKVAEEGSGLMKRRCTRCNSPIEASSAEKTWDNACPECQQPVWLAADDVVTCTVIEKSPFGIRVEIVPGIVGQIHISELATSAPPPHDLIRVGDQVQAKVLSIDPEQRRIGLSRKRVDS